MRAYKEELEIIANDLLSQQANAVGSEAKPGYSDSDFINSLIIFQTALMDKMYDFQDSTRMCLDDRLDMAEKCGSSMRLLIIEYTGLDTHKIIT